MQATHDGERAGARASLQSAYAAASRNGRQSERRDDRPRAECRRCFMFRDLMLMCSILASRSEPQLLESRILSVGLFKNGLAVVEREVKVPGAGEFAVAAMPYPVHGTFWVESDRAVTTRVTTHEITLPDV